MLDGFNTPHPQLAVWGVSFCLIFLVRVIHPSASNDQRLVKGG